MRGLRKIILCAIAAFALLLCKAQSYHFSQFYSTPLLNNPASTGNIDGSFRAAANFRSQWAQGSSPYLTSSISGDTKIFKNSIPENNRAGAGIYFMNDQSAGGALQTNSIGFSTAYAISLDGYGEQSIGIGLQGILSQRRIDYSKLSFETQYGNNGYDPSLPVGEPLNLGDKVGFDANAGVLYNYKHDYDAFFAGAAVYNTFRHNESADINSFKTPMRISVLSGGHLAIGYDQTLYASVNYMNQAKASELTIGAAYGYQIGVDKTQEINFGIWHRLKDAIIPYIGYQLNGFQAGLSYDYTISKIKTGALSKNGFELTLIYQGGDHSQEKRLMPWY